MKRFAQLQRFFHFDIECGPLAIPKRVEQIDDETFSHLRLIPIGEVDTLPALNKETFGVERSFSAMFSSTRASLQHPLQPKRDYSSMNAAGYRNDGHPHRLMYSDLVLVDVTYPNPNVFYELGIRHACRSGTIIIRNKAAEGAAPFDIGHERYIVYEEVLGGEKALAGQLRERMGWYELNPTAPDNHLLGHAKSTRFNFPQYGAELVQQRHEGIAELVKALVESDGIMDAIQALIDEQGTAPPAVKHIITALRKDPKAAVGIVSGLLKMGVIDPTKLFK